jgi:hypothetical protein
MKDRKHTKACFGLLPELGERIGSRILTADDPAFAHRLAQGYGVASTDERGYGSEFEHGGHGEHRGIHAFEPLMAQMF